MKQAVAYTEGRLLKPAKETSNGKMVIATVKGDNVRHWQEHRWRGAAVWHNYEIVVLWRDGASGENQTAREVNADLIGLSEAYRDVAGRKWSTWRKRWASGLYYPLTIGGATALQRIRR